MPSDQVEVTSADIARIAGVKPAAVSNWRRRHDDFPKPVGGTDRSPRFDLAQVESWLRTQGRGREIPASQRLWQAFDSVRGVMSPEDALGAVGLLLLHLQRHPDTAVPAKPAALAELLTRAEQEFLGDRLVATAHLADYLSAIDQARLTTLLNAAVDAARDTGQQAAGSPAEIFEQLRTRFFDTCGRAGFTPTPSELADLMVWLASTPLDGTPLDRIPPDGTPPDRALLDLACGSGTILLAGVDHGYQQLQGQELTPAVARIAALRLALRNSSEQPLDFEVRADDSLRQSAFLGRHAAAVVSNPPFAERNWGYEELVRDGTWEYGPLARMESELAWAQHALAHVAPGGAVVMLMPPGVAFRPSGRRIRRDLLTRGALAAVVSLPPGLAAHYSLALQIWVLRRPEEHANPTQLLLVDTASEVDGTKLTAREDPALVWAQVREIVTECWTDFRAAPDDFAERPGVARAVPVMDLFDEEVDLTPRRHLPLPTPPGVSGRELAATREQFAGLLATLGKTLPDAGESLPDHGPEPVRVAALAELVKAGSVFIRKGSGLGATAGPAGEGRPVLLVEGRILTGTDLVTGAAPSEVDSVDGDEVRNPPIRPSDVLVPVVARRLTARVATADDVGAYPGPTVYVVRVDPLVLDPWFLAGYLSSSDGGRQAERVGSSLGGDIRVDPRRVRIPLLPIDTQRGYGQVFQRLAEFAGTLRAAHDLGTELARNSTDAIISGLTAP